MPSSQDKSKVSTNNDQPNKSGGGFELPSSVPGVENQSAKATKKNENSKKDVRPATPLNQMTHEHLLSVLKKEMENRSPCSVVITSGNVTPNSEGVWRKDRKDVDHQGPGDPDFRQR